MSKTYHFIGIKGSGMSALALMLHQMGHKVQGSDVEKYYFTQRMQEDLLTFFTSNLDFKGLEAHFSLSRSGDESWQAKRVMERIRYLAKETHLQGENRR